MKKFNLIFDIDDTLVKSIEFGSFKDLTDLSDNLIFRKLDLPNIKLVMYYRPMLIEFIDFCFENFNVGFWTAGSSFYCKQVLKYLLTDEQYQTCNIVLSREKNDYIDLKTNIFYKNITEEYNIIKPLDLIWNDEKLSEYFNIDNTILIDNNPNVLIDNPNNSLIIKDFTRDSDDTLLNSLIELLTKIKKFSSVRSIDVISLISKFSNN